MPASKKIVFLAVQEDAWTQSGAS